MKITSNDIIAFLESKYPLDSALKWDFCGWQIKINSHLTVEKVLLCLDITNDVLNFALITKVNLIICHHPLIFAANIEDETICDNKKKLFQQLVAHKINVYSLHTNFDRALTGMNTLIAQQLAIKNPQFINNEQLVVVGKYNQPLTIQKMIAKIKSYFKIDTVQFIGDLQANVIKIALAAGAGGGEIKQLDASINCFITGEMKWNQILEANDKKLNVIIVGHQMEEKFNDFIADDLKSQFKVKLEICKYFLKKPYQFI